MYARNSIYSCELTIKDNLSKVLEKSYSGNLNILRESISNSAQNVGRNMHSKPHSVEITDGHDEYVIGHLRKGHPFYKLAKILTELCLCPRVL